MIPKIKSEEQAGICQVAAGSWGYKRNQSCAQVKMPVHRQEPGVRGSVGPAPDRGWTELGIGTRENYKGADRMIILQGPLPNYIGYSDCLCVGVSPCMFVCAPHVCSLHGARRGHLIP